MSPGTSRAKLRGMSQPLQGVRLLDLGQVYASPFASYLLGLLGAEVIKVEPPGGEWLRRMGSGGLAYATQNAGKRPIVVDLKQPGGAEVVLRLAAGCDIFVEGFAPGTAARMGVGFDAVKARNPSVVYGSLSAFGDTGPYADRPGFDHVVQAVTGIMASTGFDGQPPTKVGAPFLDYGAGLLLAFALLAGVLEQRRTGEAVAVDVTMLDVGLLLNASGLVRAANTGLDAPRTGNDAFSGAVASGAFETADGLLMIAANKVSHFVRVCDALGLQDLADQPALSLPGADPSIVAAARARMADAFATRSAAEWESILVAAKVPAARVRSTVEVATEGHVAARGLLSAVDVAGEDRPTLVPSAGIRINGEMPSARGPVLAPGTETDAVLSEAGFDADEIARLREAAVVA